METQTTTVQIEVHSKEDNFPIYKTSTNPISYAKNVKITKEDVKGVPGAFLLHNALTIAESQEFIKISESMGYGVIRKQKLFLINQLRKLRYQLDEGW
jgi:hypothetical protein